MMTLPLRGVRRLCSVPTDPITLQSEPSESASESLFHDA